MKFESGDEIDQALCKVIIHEFSRCQLSFDLFLNLKRQKYLSKYESSTEINLITYNAYALFLQHLYEQFHSCLKRDYQNTANIPFEILDKLLNKEINRILQNNLELIEYGKEPENFNDRSYYCDKCPEDFGTKFREVRNDIVHADYRRIIGSGRITLTDFYIKYHKYVILLYYSGKEWWDINKFNNIDLGDVTNFNNLT